MTGPIVTVLPQPSSAGWQPVRGPETEGIVYPAGSKERIVEEAIRILGKCLRPGASTPATTGLVVGYVQSGKTTSFTTVAALARDNRYRMVIVITGTKVNLLDQSTRRLLKSLRVNDRSGPKPWRHFQNPSVDKNDHIMIRRDLDVWDMPIQESAKRTVLITVMKWHQHLENLIEVIRAISPRNCPTLIIDDEADQASLNTVVRRGAQSRTYGQILSLKDSLPAHSYLQYTATPQALLLINIIDVLSPGFADVVTPGNGYVGGQTFFRSGSRLVRTIPISDIPTPGAPVVAPPGSLMEAMRIFLVGAAVGILRNNENDVRSVMVRPSMQRAGHDRSKQWVDQVMAEWIRVLDLAPSDPDRVDLLRLFKAAHDELAGTVTNLPSFDEVTGILPLTLRRTNVRVLNSTTPGGAELDWSSEYSWILVGGQAMDRGFTVEGLTVTYMPRGIGVGNADTVQQRARFLGYKEPYLGYCRVFLEAGVRDAFERYLSGEEDIRNQLISHRESGRPLSEWRREFFSPQNLHPTRTNVIDVAYQRIVLGAGWHYPDGPHDSSAAMEANRLLLSRTRSSLPFMPWDGLDLRQDSDRNLVAGNLPLRRIHEELLAAFRLPRLEDLRTFYAILRRIQAWLVQNPNDTGTVYLMAGGKTRRRGYSGKKIDQPFQGPQYAGPAGAAQMTYPGDREVRAPNGVSVQVGYLRLAPPRDNSPGAVIADDVPFPAVWIPPEMDEGAVIQPQGGPRP